MSALYDLASLVLVPSGYKASKVYAQKPMTTDGQLTFSRASTATRTNASGVIESVASNVPRLDYSGGATCPSLLLEPQRTNLFSYSEQFDNAAWGKTRLTITANTTVSPDGTQNADTASDTTFTSSTAFVDRTIGVTVSQPYTHSVFVKAGTAPHIYVGIFDGVSYFCILSATTGQITFTTSNTTSSVVSYGNGWYRISLTRVVSNATVYPFIGVCQLSNDVVYNGTGTYTAQIWGAQFEAGAFPTSYIPTTTAAVTRLADACSKTGISSLIGQTEGTLFAEIPLQYLNFANYRGIISVSDGTFDNGAFVLVNNSGGNSNQFALSYRSSGSTVASLLASNLSSANIGSTYKIAIAYKANDFVFYVNGVQIGSDTSGSIAGTLSRLDLGSIGYTGLSTIDRQSVSQAILFKTRLTNAQLAELTTL